MSSRRAGPQNTPAAALESVDVTQYESATDAIRAALSTVPRWECPDCSTAKYTRPSKCSTCDADGDRFKEVLP